MEMYIDTLRMYACLRSRLAKINAFESCMVEITSQNSIRELLTYSIDQNPTYEANWF